ncbi:hypothetical protein C8R43DRAFT_322913 [Mycena crocata]|nr:hypothetical protein C8R43DRAFT_322913 [Mycena crocata]
MLDLYDISLLLNYERASNDPRFRHAKLREVASASSPFKTIIMPAAEWFDCETTKDGFVFDTIQPTSFSERNLPDLPSNMKQFPTHPSVQCLTPKDLERIYWQVRGFDSCFKPIALLQHFFALYPGVKLRVRTSDGTDFVTFADLRNIQEMRMTGPKLMTVICMIGGQVHITGDEASMVHSVMEFTNPDSADDSSVILDLSSLQFGDAGRGISGRSTSVLESRPRFMERLGRIADDTTFTKTSQRIRPYADDPWLKLVAKKVKERWEKRHEEPWCGHCGAPGAKMLKCSLCQQAAYCDKVHQTAAWPFHKVFCSGKQGPSV